MKKAKYKVGDIVETDQGTAKITGRKYTKKDLDFPSIAGWWYEVEYFNPTDELHEDCIN